MNTGQHECSVFASAKNGRAVTAGPKQAYAGIARGTFHEPIATILLPNCLKRHGTGRDRPREVAEKSPINRDFWGWHVT
jgi:hypothetical protein